jgi:hypothetical protein
MQVKLNPVKQERLENAPESPLARILSAPPTYPHNVNIFLILVLRLI